MIVRQYGRIQLVKLPSHLLSSGHLVGDVPVIYCEAMP
jgi:hypothetical protein